MTVEELGPGVQVDVGPVGHVQSQLLGLVDDRELVADEVGRPTGPVVVVGAVERDDPGPVRVVAPGGVMGEAEGLVAVAVVEAVATPPVVGLPGGHALLDHEGRPGGVVPNAQGDELLLAGGADQLQQVRPRRPALVDGHVQGRGPLALDGVDEHGQGRRGLTDPDHLGRLPHQPAPDAPVVPHAVRLDMERGGPGAHEQGDGLSCGGAHLAGVALDVPGGLGRGDPPQVTGLGVLGHDGLRGGQWDAVSRAGDRLGAPDRDDGLARGQPGVGRRVGRTHTGPQRGAGRGRHPVGRRLGHGQGRGGGGGTSGRGEADERPAGEQR